jgi:hypothetical protein
MSCLLQTPQHANFCQPLCNSVRCATGLEFCAAAVTNKTLVLQVKFSRYRPEQAQEDPVG